MRAAILLVPLAAFAAIVSAGGQPDVANDAYGDDGMNGMTMELSNESMDMNMSSDGVDGSMDMDSFTNMTAPERPRPAWLGRGFWLIAGEEPSGALWYFEPFQSDFSRSPFRVLLRTDETPDASRRYNNTERRAEIDCAAGSYRITGSAHYDDSGRRTEVDEDSEGRTIRPEFGTTWAEVVETVCLHDARQRGGDAASNAM